MQISGKNRRYILLIFILTLGAFLRFYKLDWGQGLYSHPDEYHIVSSVAQLSFPAQMHPHFFSYGTVTIYLIYFTQEMLKFISETLNYQLSTINSFLIGRFYSALFSTLTIILIYKICVYFMKRRFAYFAALLTAITPGLIQQAHFATPESTLTFFLFESLFFIIKFAKKNSLFDLSLASLFLGFALGVKISSIVFLLPLIITIIFNSLKDPFRLIGIFITSIFMIFITFRISAPYVFIDFPAFRSNLEYEGGLAIGKIAVFYTRQFIDTLPILFQAEKILPYALGPFILLFSALGFVLAVINLIKKPKVGLIIIMISFLSLFIPNAFLFAKWTRFIAPTFPFFAIFSVFLLQQFSKKNRLILHSLTIILITGTIVWTMMFFSIYINTDIRMTASKWLETNVKPKSGFLVEGGNTIDLPLKGNFQRTSLDFYSLEDNPSTREQIANALYASDYFLVQSRRLFMNHQRLPQMFPNTARFYDSLFSGDLGFTQIKEFHQYPKLDLGGLRLEVADETAEETWSVFDHPVIRVFEKTKQFSKEDYAKFLE